MHFLGDTELRSEPQDSLVEDEWVNKEAIVANLSQVRLGFNCTRADTYVCFACSLSWGVDVSDVALGANLQATCWKRYGNYSQAALAQRADAGCQLGSRARSVASTAACF